MMDMTGASCLDHDAVMLLGDESRMEHLYELLMRRFGLLSSFSGCERPNPPAENLLHAHFTKNRRLQLVTFHLVCYHPNSM